MPAIHIMRVPIEGGTPELVEGSVDLKRIHGGRHELLSGWQVDAGDCGFTSIPRRKPLTNKMALIDVNANSLASTKFLIPRPEIRRPIAFTPDGKAVAYKIVENGVGNVWAQPLDGSPGHRLTNFTSDQHQHIPIFARRQIARRRPAAHCFRRRSATRHHRISREGNRGFSARITSRSGKTPTPRFPTFSEPRLSTPSRNSARRRGIEVSA